MTIETPLWMQGVAGVPGYPARLDRMLFAQLWDEGVMDLTALKVSQRAAGANFTVDVSIGEAVVQGDDQALQGNYMARVTAIESGAITAAPGSNSRYDLVCLRINDPNAGGAAGSTATIVVTAGVVAAVPTVPVTPPSSLLLAVIGPITSGTGSITNAIITDARLLAGRRCTPGTIEETANAVEPNGWLFANGAAKSRAVYARLFAHIGTTFGAGDGSTTFNMPDYRGRVGVGLDNMGGTDAGRLTVANALGGVGGAELHTLTTAELAAHAHVQNAHNHAITDPQHRHDLESAAGSDPFRQWNPLTDGGVDFKVLLDFAAAPSVNFELGNRYTDLDDTGITINNATPTEQNAGGGAAHNNMPPYVLVNVLVRT